VSATVDGDERSGTGITRRMGRHGPRTRGSAIGLGRGIFGREFWDRAVKLGIDILGQVHRVGRSGKMPSSVEKSSRLGWTRSDHLQEGRVAAADGALGVISG